MYSIHNSYTDTIEELVAIKGYSDEKSLCSLIQNVISSYGNKIKSYVIEEYIESEWMDIHSVYYGKQRKNISSTTIRVHFIIENITKINQINDINYYGYITLRPISNNDDLTISRIRIRYDKSYYETSNLFVIDYEAKVSFPHCQIKFSSFPFFRQDGMVTVCAHADMHMMVKVMHNVHGFNSYGIENILNQLNSKFGRDVPNEGLSIYEMLSALKSRGYNPMLTLFKNAEYVLDNNEHVYSIFDFIDAMIESQLPIILAFESHVIIISGASRNDEGEIEKYLIFDDSGYHLNKMTKLAKEDLYPNHSRLIKKDVLLEKVIVGDTFVLVPTFKSLFYRYKFVYKHVNNMHKAMVGEANDLHYRITLVDSKQLKIFLNNIGEKGYEDILLPRHVWYVEFYSRDGVMKILLVDAMAHQYGLDLEIIANSSGVKIVDVHKVNKLVLLKEV